MFNKTFIGVIGPNQDSCSAELYQFGINLGTFLKDKRFYIVCGGKFGIMEAVCRGARQSRNYEFGCTIGIIPESEKKEANKFVDIIIPSGLGIARNSIIINTSDIIIAAGGGAGTLSELAFAWQKNKPVFCNTSFDGWSKRLVQKSIDVRHSNFFKPFTSIDELNILLIDFLDKNYK